MTDHPALDFNAAFSSDGHSLAFVSTRNGNHELYLSGIDGKTSRRLTHEFALDDHPSWSPDGSFLVFSSTREPSDRPGQAWNALYVMRLDRDEAKSESQAAADSAQFPHTHHLSPPGVADYSPAWSPRGDLIACATGSGEIGGTDIVVMTPTGTDRRVVVKNGGWPAFAADGQTLFFHSKREGRWGIWQVAIDGSHLERITPSNVDAFTPSAARDGKKLVVVVVRNGHRQIALLDLSNHSLEALTEDASDHWNPTISPDGRFVVYHQSRPDMKVPNVELWGTPPATDLRLLRLAGAFPAFAPDGRRLALTGGSFAQLDVMNLDGSERRTLYEGKPPGALQHVLDPPRRSNRLRASDRLSRAPRMKSTSRRSSLTVRVSHNSQKLPATMAFRHFRPTGSGSCFARGRGDSRTWRSWMRIGAISVS